MVCKNCGQEMIDKKEFCISCGTKLSEHKKTPTKLVIIVGIILVIVGIITCYLIINYKTEEEIAPFIDKKIEDNTK